MFHNRFTRLCIIIIAVLFLLIIVPVVSGEQKTKLKGHVLAVSFWPISKDLMHGNIRVQEFIFGMETKDSSGNDLVVPVFVVYRSYPDSEKFLPEIFFDYSKKYELSVINENYDISFKDVAYVNFVSNGIPVLPADLDLPWQRLEILNGVPESILNMDMDIMLSKYELSSNNYKILKDASQK